MRKGDRINDTVALVDSIVNWFIAGWRSVLPDLSVENSVQPDSAPPVSMARRTDSLPAADHRREHLRCLVQLLVSAPD